ncbi:integrin alpha [Pseudomonadota bacterium]
MKGSVPFIAIANVGDVNDDGIRDLVVGAPNDDDGPDNAGAVWILFMD